LGRSRGNNRNEARRAGNLMATLAKLLQVEMGLPDMAKRLAAAGRGKDSILAHINPKEAKLLKKHGGKGTINPNTGIMEFDDGYGFTEDTAYDYAEPAPSEPVASRPVPNVTIEGDTSQGADPVYQGRQKQYSQVDPFRAEQGYAKTQPGSGLGGDASSRSPAQPRSISDYYGTAPADDDATSQVASGRQYQPASAYRAPYTPVSVYNRRPVAEATPPFQQSTITGDLGGRVADQTINPAAPVAVTPEEEEGFASRLNRYSDKVAALNKTLEPFAPYAKFGAQALGIYQAQKAANETRKQAEANAAEIKRLADPYRAQAAQFAEQGQKLVTMGQQGQLTAEQQQQLETQRAMAVQQQAQAGVAGSTAQQQAEAQIQRLSQQYAQNNINQGLQLLAQAQSISGTADKLIQEAIRTGYAGSQDAARLASEFYNAIGYSLPETQSKTPGQSRGGQ